MLDALLALCCALPRQEAPPPLKLAAAKADELMADFAPLPLDDRQREQRLFELFTAPAVGEVQALDLDPALVAERRDAARAALRKRLAAAKAPPAEIDAAIADCDARFAAIGRNVVAIVPGRTRRILIFAAHYDAAPGSRGVVDNWASCLLLARLQAAIAAAPLEHTVWLAGLAGHELGGVGAAALVASLRDKQEAKIDGCVTIDGAGAAAPSAWWSGSSDGLLELVVDSAKRAAVPLRLVDFPGGGGDSAPFLAAKLPVASLLGIGPEQAGLLHGPGDQVGAIVPEHLRAMHRLTLALAVTFDGHPEPLRGDYLRAKLRLGVAGGRAPAVPEKVVWPAPAPAAPPAAVRPAAPIRNDPKPHDGSSP